MRLFFADLLMVLGILAVQLGAYLGGTEHALSIIAAGVGLAVFGYVLDARNRLRGLVTLGIAVSWMTAFGLAAFALIVAYAAIVRSLRVLTADD